MESLVGKIIVSEFVTISQLDRLFLEMSASEQANLAIYCVGLQESTNPEIREFGLARAANIQEKEIIHCFSALFELKKSHQQAVRDLVSDLFDRISSAGLVSQLGELIDLVRSPYSFVRGEAAKLLNKIDSISLIGEFDYLVKLEDDSDSDVRGTANVLILKIINAWPLEEKVKHYNFAVKIQKSHYEEFQLAGNLLALQIIETWEPERQRELLTYFIKLTQSDSFEISELAASLALKVLSGLSKMEHFRYLDYLTSFNYYGNKVLRRAFRHLALMTLNFLDEECLPKFALFLLQCLEGRDPKDRTIAWKLLLEINPNKLPVQDLIDCQASGLHRVRRASKKLVNKINEETLVKNLEIFLNAQKSTDRDVRYMGSRLATKISLKLLSTRKDVIESHARSKDPMVADLAECLLYLI